jgi:2',3'-cyclic-nucleotide 2'-phosphodiesterase (5'-nucleotidase family)
MDAGDFMEGNLYYLADRGKMVFNVHNEMGYDIGALGNHDYMMGSHDLDKMLNEIDLKFSFITANINVDYAFKNIRKKIKPYKELEIDGIKIGVLGLTTNEFVYSWLFDGCKITNPYKAAKHYEKILKARNNDFIIALTHIGVLHDIKLAEKTKFIDLIVGGHSHTALYEPSYGINRDKRSVPIVQAGMHMEYLGRILIDIEKGQPLKIVEYNLIPVNQKASDARMKELVLEADKDLDNLYGQEWLNEEVGFSNLKADDVNGIRKWAYFITDTLKEKSQSEIAIHSPYMNGENFPVGKVTRRDLFNSIPRIYNLDQKYGWSIYRATVKGMWLASAFEALTHFGQPLTFSGLTMNYDRTKLGVKIKRILVNGKPIRPYKNYSVAFTEGVVLGAMGVGKYTSAILKDPENTKFKIWMSLEEKIAQSGKKINATEIKEENHHIYIPSENIELPD